MYHPKESFSCPACMWSERESYDGPLRLGQGMARLRTPTLVRFFVRYGEHNSYENTSSVPKNELRFYLWPESTVQDIIDLVLESLPSIRQADCQLSLGLVYPDKQARLKLRKVGVFFASSQRRRDDLQKDDEQKTLQDLRFEPGDYIDLAILGLKEPAIDQFSLEENSGQQD